MHRLGWLWEDTRYGLRMLGKSPGFTLVAVLTLALGIGANTAIFSVVNAVLLQPLPYPQPDRLVQLVRSFPEGTGTSVSVPKFMVWHDQPQLFQAVALHDFAGPGINLTGGDRPEQVKGIHASAGYFAVFGARMALGRTFTADEDRPGGPHVAVISNGLWHGRFGGDPAIIGKTIGLGGDPYEVIGVLGPDFSNDPPTDIWLPLQADPNSTDQGHYLLATARLLPGVSVAKAQAGMKLAAERFRRKFPGNTFMAPRESATAKPMRDIVVANVRPALLVLSAAVGFVLLIACANVANLLLARASLRSREIAIRATLGASRRRIVSQLLTESLILSLAGGILGLLLGYLGVRTLLTMNPGNIPRIANQASVTLDWRVLAFTLFISVLTGILFGLVPALHASQADLGSNLKESGARSGAGLRQTKTRSVLVITEMGIALVLLAGAVLLIRTFVALRTVNPGFNSHNLLTMQMSLAGTRFEKTAAVAQFVRDARRRIQSLPGVTMAAVTCSLPLEPSFDLPFDIDAHPPTNSPYSGDTQWRSVSAGYFEAFQIPLLRGRLLTSQDEDDRASRVVIINQAMAKQFWSNDDPLGESITIGAGLGPEFIEPSRQIIGIVGDIHDTGLNESNVPIMYIPVAQVSDGLTALDNRIIPINWVIRTKMEPYVLNAEIQREIRIASGGLPVAHVRSMDQVLAEATARADFNMTLLTIFGGIALLLAAIGIYGLMAYSVQQRRQEIGIRMVLGASPRQVSTMVVVEGMRLVGIGIALGVALALALMRLIASLLYGVNPWDPMSLALVALGLAVVALLSCWIPTRKAMRIDPMVALRYE